MVRKQHAALRIAHRSGQRESGIECAGHPVPDQTARAGKHGQSQRDVLHHARLGGVDAISDDHVDFGDHETVVD